MGLFDKKYCSICNKELGLLGHKGLADGHICKECYSKLSPWYRHSKSNTAADMKKQLEYREANKEKLNNFNPTLVLGGDYKVYVDENNKCFVVSRSKDWRKVNPDIIELKDVKSVDLRIDEDKEELYEEVDGKRISYDPKVYSYEYQFYLDIIVDNPYFNNIKFEVTDGETASGDNPELYYYYKYTAEKIQHALMPNSYPEPVQGSGSLLHTDEVVNNTGTWTCPKCNNINTTQFCPKCGTARPSVWYCPNCGKENSGNFCVACGNKKPVNI